MIKANSAFTFTILMILGSLQTASADWKAGSAKVNITPPKLMWMSGYASRTRPAEGKLTDLWAKALVLDNGADNRAVLRVRFEHSPCLIVHEHGRFHLGRGALVLCHHLVHDGVAEVRPLRASHGDALPDEGGGEVEQPGIPLEYAVGPVR